MRPLRADVVLRFPEIRFTSLVFLSRVSSTQNSGALGARNACNAGGLAQDRLAGQPGKSGGFYLERWQPKCVGCSHLTSRQGELQAVHQVAV